MIHDVACRSGKDPYSTTKRTLELLEFSRIVSGNENVVIKPNLICNKHPSTGITTHPEVVEAIVDWISIKTKKIYVAESDVGVTFTKAEQNFSDCGYVELAKRKKIKLASLTKNKHQLIKLPQGLYFKEYWLPKVLIDADIIINVPVAKTHNITAITLGMKNLFGFISEKYHRKVEFHKDIFILIDRKLSTSTNLVINRGIDNVLLDLYTVFKPKLKLTVIDGIVGSDGYLGCTFPTYVNSNFICAGYDLFSVDRVGTELMGINPRKISHLAKAETLGLGSFNDRINLKGTDFSKVKRKFSLGFEKALAVMDALLDSTTFLGNTTYEKISSMVNIDEKELRTIVDGLCQFNYLSIKDNRIKIKPSIYTNYLSGKTAIIN